MYTGNVQLQVGDSIHTFIRQDETEQMNWFTNETNIRK